MDKGHLIQIHSVLVHVRRQFETVGKAPVGCFAEYEALGVSPQHVHRSKQEHKTAILLLGKCIMLMLSGSELERSRVEERFARLVAHDAPDREVAEAVAFPFAN